MEEDGVKYLGLNITPSLTWSEHIRVLINRSGQHIFILKRLAYRSSSTVFVTRLYLSLLRPALEYASIAFDSCGNADAFKLERVQLSVGRAILKGKRREMSNDHVLVTLNWPTLAWRRRRTKLLYLWKLVNGQGPPALRAALPPKPSARADYSFRSTHSLQFPACQTSRRLCSFLLLLLVFGMLSQCLFDQLLLCPLTCLVLILIIHKINAL